MMPSFFKKLLKRTDVEIIYNYEKFSYLSLELEKAEWEADYGGGNKRGWEPESARVQYHHLKDIQKLIHRWKGFIQIPQDEKLSISSDYFRHWNRHEKTITNFKLSIKGFISGVKVDEHFERVGQFIDFILDKRYETKNLTELDIAKFRP